MKRETSNAQETDKFDETTQNRWNNETCEDRPGLPGGENRMLLGTIIVVALIVAFLTFRRKIAAFLEERNNRPLYYGDYGKGPFPTGRPRKERGH